MAGDYGLHGSRLEVGLRGLERQACRENAKLRSREGRRGCTSVKSFLIGSVCELKVLVGKGVVG